MIQKKSVFFKVQEGKALRFEDEKSHPGAGDAGCHHQYPEIAIKRRKEYEDNRPNQRREPNTRHYPEGIPGISWNPIPRPVDRDERPAKKNASNQQTDQQSIVEKAKVEPTITHLVLARSHLVQWQ